MTYRRSKTLCRTLYMCVLLPGIKAKLKLLYVEHTYFIEFAKYLEFDEQWKIRRQ